MAGLRRIPGQLLDERHGAGGDVDGGVVHCGPPRPLPFPSLSPGTALRGCHRVNRFLRLAR
ncbi:hypothetical protein ACFFX0_23275 [Citricoccus parietis]|uniref:Uncharacterized protein n=1 Tax=Citricoccus parietis TaxID=592307 RepID=A0ABV5G4Y5_9MICC